VDSNDLNVNGFDSPADGRNVTLQVGESGRYVNCSGGSPGCTQISPTCRDLGNCPPDPSPGGIKSREWRQLFMR
jgi:hypothetical protein